MDNKSHDEKKLPKWAQKRLDDLRYQIKMLQSLKKAHNVLNDKEWFTIPWKEKEPMNLYILFKNQPLTVCSLSPGDTLLVGRAK